MEIRRCNETTLGAAGRAAFAKKGGYLLQTIDGVPIPVRPAVPKAAFEKDEGSPEERRAAQTWQIEASAVLMRALAQADGKKVRLGGGSVCRRWRSRASPH